MLNFIPFYFQKKSNEELSLLPLSILIARIFSLHSGYPGFCRARKKKKKMRCDPSPTLPHPLEPVAIASLINPRNCCGTLQSSPIQCPAPAGVGSYTACGKLLSIIPLYLEFLWRNGIISVTKLKAT